MHAVKIRDISKSFGATPVLSGISLDIAKGEFFFLLGPSGCGKTTLLRVLAGFERPDRGNVFFGDRDVTALAPQKRNASLVFQNYALWPHLSVAQNVAYGLQTRGIPPASRNKRVTEALALVRMEDFAARLPNQLSGGQQQRVALARALVVEPELLLLDEPLSNLDARLRLDMRLELLRLHRRLGLTTVYVTHDQEEALSLADRIAFIDGGKVVQTGSPAVMYYHPVNVRTARFLGNANVAEGTVRSRDGAAVSVETPLGTLAGTAPGESALTAGSKAYCFFRPEHVRPAGQGPAGANLLRGTVSARMFSGHYDRVFLECNGTAFEATAPAGSQEMKAGETASFVLDPEHLRVLEG